MRQIKLQYKIIWYTYNTMQCNTIQCNAMQYITIQYNTTQHNTIPYHTTQYNTIYTQYHALKYSRFNEAIFFSKLKIKC